MHLGEIRPRDHCDSSGDGVPCNPPRLLSAAHHCALRTLAQQLPGQFARRWDRAEIEEQSEELRSNCKQQTGKREERRKGRERG
eukprot:3000033-Rhodomonas_salina.1